MLVKPQLRTGFFSNDSRVPNLHHKDLRSIFRQTQGAATQEITQLHFVKIKVKQISTWIPTNNLHFKLQHTRLTLKNPSPPQYKHDY